jgi:predicted nucleic acid-binding protein
MNVVFADTFYFIALSNPRDQNHQRAVTFTAAFQGRLVTTAWVLTEFANYMSDPKNREEFLSILTDLRNNAMVTIVPPTESLFEEGLQFYSSRTDKGWSLTDCISFRVMERDGIIEAATGDHHFEQAGFRALLKP